MQSPLAAELNNAQVANSSPVEGGNPPRLDVSPGQERKTRTKTGFTPTSLVDTSISDTTLRIATSSYALSAAVTLTATIEQESIEHGIELIKRMIWTKAPVRVIALGRARLSLALGSNRLVHAGGNVHVVYDVTPLPNTILGGYLIVGSASGKTKDVLEMMRTTRRSNKHIAVLGFADHSATEFRDLCDIFVGIRPAGLPNPIHALADLGEHVIGQMFDRMVVIAAHRLGLVDSCIRLGHEDLSTGPYGPTDVFGLDGVSVSRKVDFVNSESIPG